MTRKRNKSSSESSDSASDNASNSSSSSDSDSSQDEPSPVKKTSKSKASSSRRSQDDGRKGSERSGRVEKDHSERRKKERRRSQSLENSVSNSRGRSSGSRRKEKQDSSSSEDEDDTNQRQQRKRFQSSEEDERRSRPERVRRNESDSKKELSSRSGPDRRERKSDRRGEDDSDRRDRTAENRERNSDRRDRRSDVRNKDEPERRERDSEQRSRDRQDKHDRERQTGRSRREADERQRPDKRESHSTSEDRSGSKRKVDSKESRSSTSDRSSRTHQKKSHKDVDQSLERESKRSSRSSPGREKESPKTEPRRKRHDSTDSSPSPEKERTKKSRDVSPRRSSKKSVQQDTLSEEENQGARSKDKKASKSKRNRMSSEESPDKSSKRNKRSPSPIETKQRRGRKSPLEKKSRPHNKKSRSSSEDEDSSPERHQAPSSSEGSSPGGARSKKQKSSSAERRPKRRNRDPSSDKESPARSEELSSPVERFQIFEPRSPSSSPERLQSRINVIKKERSPARSASSSPERLQSRINVIKKERSESPAQSASSRDQRSQSRSSSPTEVVVGRKHDLTKFESEPESGEITDSDDEGSTDMPVKSYINNPKSEHSRKDADRYKGRSSKRRDSDEEDRRRHEVDEEDKELIERRKKREQRHREQEIERRDAEKNKESDSRISGRKHPTDDRNTDGQQGDKAADEPRPAAKKTKANLDVITGRTGGAYIPPAKLRAMQASITDKTSEAYQRISWEALKKSINGLINKVNVSNLIDIVRELFQENIVRGRGTMSRSILQAQSASLTFTHVYSALVAIINTKFPQNGELILRRCIIQFKRGFRRNDKSMLLSSTRFIAHLVNQQVAHEVLALEILTLLLETPTDDSVEVSIGFLKECGQKLTEVSPRGINAIFERIRNILHEGMVDTRVQYMMEVMFAVRKDGFKDHPAVLEDLDLVEEDDQFTHLLTLEDGGDPEDILNIFKVDPEFGQNEEKYKMLKKEILDEGSDDGETSGSGDNSDDSDDDSDADEEAKQTIIDNTETNLVSLRRTIYLTIQSSLDFEECAHKILKMELKPGQEIELCNMILDCCAQTRTYEKFFGLLAQRFCMIDKKYVTPFQNMFKEQYDTIHRLETNKLRNVSKFFAHLLHTDALNWGVMSCIALNEEDTTSASRIFIKILFQELSEYLGLPKLNDRLKDPTLQEYFVGVLPRDNPRNTRFAINFFTTIGLGGLTDDLREHLKNVSKKLMQQKQQEAAVESESDSDDSSSSDSSSSGSDSSSSDSSSDSGVSDSDSSGSSESEADKRKKKRKTKTQQESKMKKKDKHSSKSDKKGKAKNGISPPGSIRDRMRALAAGDDNYQNAPAGSGEPERSRHVDRDDVVGREKKAGVKRQHNDSSEGYGDGRNIKSRKSDRTMRESDQVNRSEIPNDKEEHYSGSRDRDRNSKKDRYVGKDLGRGQNDRDSQRGQKDERENRDRTRDRERDRGDGYDEQFGKQLSRGRERNGKEDRNFERGSKSDRFDDQDPYDERDANRGRVTSREKAPRVERDDDRYKNSSRDREASPRERHSYNNERDSYTDPWERKRRPDRVEESCRGYDDYVDDDRVSYDRKKSGKRDRSRNEEQVENGRDERKRPR